MSAKVPLQKNSFGLTSYEKVIDTKFRQLVPPQQPSEVEFTVDDFFRLYEELFFQIPLTGENNSHEYLIKTSGEYIGEPVLSDNEKALIEEINELRNQLVELTRDSING